jgi:putative endonuclease
MSNRSRTLYIGVTGFLMARIIRHKKGEGGEFTKKYRTHRLVYFQSFHNVVDAIARETQLKKWCREKKVALIEERNPTWEDLAEGWGAPTPMRINQLQPTLT